MLGNNYSKNTFSKRWPFLNGTCYSPLCKKDNVCFIHKALLAACVEYSEDHPCQMELEDVSFIAGKRLSPWQNIVPFQTFFFACTGYLCLIYVNSPPVKMRWTFDIIVHFVVYTLPKVSQPRKTPGAFSHHVRKAAFQRRQFKALKFKCKLEAWPRKEDHNNAYY